jgi:hypothetical protein
VTVGLSLGHSRASHEGARGHWHRAFTVQATGAQPQLPRACARGHCPVPTGARRMERRSSDPDGRTGRDRGGRAEDRTWAGEPKTEQGRVGRGLDLDGGITLGVGARLGIKCIDNNFDWIVQLYMGIGCKMCCRANIWRFTY